MLCIRSCQQARQQPPVWPRHSELPAPCPPWQVYVSEQKLATLRCLGLGQQQLDATFTSDPGASQVHVCGWGFLGDTWPFFRPNFVNLEKYRAQYGARRVSHVVLLLHLLLAGVAACALAYMPAASELLAPWPTCLLLPQS